MFKKLFRRTEIRNFTYRPGSVQRQLSVFEYREICKKVAAEWNDNSLSQDGE